MQVGSLSLVVLLDLISCEDNHALVFSKVTPRLVKITVLAVLKKVIRCLQKVATSLLSILSSGFSLHRSHHLCCFALSYPTSDLCSTSLFVQPPSSYQFSLTAYSITPPTSSFLDPRNPCMKKRLNFLHPNTLDRVYSPTHHSLILITYFNLPPLGRVELCLLFTPVYFPLDFFLSGRISISTPLSAQNKTCLYSCFPALQCSYVTAHPFSILLGP